MARDWRMPPLRWPCVKTIRALLTGRALFRYEWAAALLLVPLLAVLGTGLLCGTLAHHARTRAGGARLSVRTCLPFICLCCYICCF